MRRRCSLSAALLAGLVVMVPAGASAKSDRSVVFISDSHLGTGHAEGNHGGAWDNYEDARWPEDLAAFLEDVQANGNGKVDLVLNGDTFELWQSHTVPCKYADRDLGCDDADASRRMERVVGQHPGELKALVDFSRHGDNRVFLNIGNHDVALSLPGVQRVLRSALGPGSERIVILGDGVWQSRDGLILAEHGQQIAGDPNAFASWPKATVSSGGALHVVRPWGEQFVQEFYNQYEAKYPIIDNLTSESEGIRLGLKLERLPGGLRGAGAVLKFMLFEESRAQLAGFLAPQGAVPIWNVEAERAKKHRFLVQSFAPGVVAPMIATEETKKELDDYVSDPQRLTAAEIRDICDLRYAAVETGENLRTCQQDELSGEGGEELGAVVQRLLHTPEKRVEMYVARRDKPPKVFVYSHTHGARKFLVAGGRIEVLNTGAWQRLISPARLQQIAKEHHEKPEAAFARMTPSELDPCYTFVIVPPYADNPRPALQSWRFDAATKKWGRSPILCNQ